jgi:hypothetical protein
MSHELKLLHLSDMLRDTAIAVTQCRGDPDNVRSVAKAKLRLAKATAQHLRLPDEARLIDDVCIHVDDMGTNDFRQADRLARYIRCLEEDINGVDERRARQRSRWEEICRAVPRDRQRDDRAADRDRDRDTGRRDHSRDRDRDGPAAWRNARSRTFSRGDRDRDYGRRGGSDAPRREGGGGAASAVGRFLAL